MTTWGLPPTAWSLDAIIPRTHDCLMESQLPKVFKRILGLDQGARRNVEPVHQPGQEKAQSRPAAQDRQRLAFELVERSQLRVGLQQRAPFGDIVRKVLLEAPGIEADRNVIGEGIGAGKVKVDKARQFVAEKEYV